MASSARHLSTHRESSPEPFFLCIYSPSVYHQRVLLVKAQSFAKALSGNIDRKFVEKIWRFIVLATEIPVSFVLPGCLLELELLSKFDKEQLASGELWETILE